MEEEETIEVTPPWSGVALAILARGAGINVFDAHYRIEPQRRPLLGDDGYWIAEAYIDTGSRSARGLRGVEEGFVLKTSVLLRYWDGRRLVERILYPFSRGAPSFLLLPGDDRKRQASLYVAELAMALSLLEDNPRLPSKITEAIRGKPRLVIRHGSLLQSLGTYFNKVFDLDESTAKSLLLYVGLNEALVYRLLEEAVVKRRGGIEKKVNPGLLAAAILREIKDASASRGHTVIGLTEDVSKGRHLIALVLEKTVRSAIDDSRHALAPEALVDRALAHDETARECLRDLYPGDADSFRSAVDEWFTDLVKMLFGRDRGRDRYSLYRVIRESDEHEIVEAIYERQILNLVSLASDSHFLLLYNYLFGSPGEHPASIEVDKSWLYKPRIRDSYSKRIEGDDTLFTRALTLDQVIDAVDGVRLRYIFPERVPSCNELAEISYRHGMDRRLVAELIRVIPPIRVEYFSSIGDGERPIAAMEHVLAQSMITQYGVPPQLLVVDARSRINEWEYEALASMVEVLSKRTMPYSTFIRDFSVRRHYIL